MKILHLIDSLNPGGAERMAVAYANALSQRGEETLLWSTREEGILKETLHPQVQYRFLNRKGPVGFKALFAASKQIKKENIRLIHAHATSFFFATLLKWFNPQLKLIWHDHYGSRNQSRAQANGVLIFCAKYFDQVFAVNKDLVNWHQTHLKQHKSKYLPNFVSFTPEDLNASSVTTSSKTIVCVANLRNPKNHLNLINAFSIIHKNAIDWKLHLIGKSFDDDYSKAVQNLINEKLLTNNVVLFGQRNDVFKQLQQAEIGVLSSDSEGLPLALLEYALAGLPVVTTDVGYCREVVQNFGKVVPPQNPEALATALLEYIEQPGQRKTDARLLQKQVVKNYTEAAVLPEVLDIYRELLGINQ